MAAFGTYVPESRVPGTDDETGRSAAVPATERQSDNAAVGCAEIAGE